MANSLAESTMNRCDFLFSQWAMWFNLNAEIHAGWKRVCDNGLFEVGSIETARLGGADNEYVRDVHVEIRRVAPKPNFIMSRVYQTHAQGNELCAG